MSLSCNVVYRYREWEIFFIGIICGILEEKLAAQSVEYELMNNIFQIITEVVICDPMDQGQVSKS